MSKFRNIDYSKMLYEALRSYFSVNKAGELSYLYKLLTCIIWPLKLQWDSFETYRKKMWLISQCKWALGQLTNLLNYLYDPINNSIFLLQSSITLIFAPVIAETSSTFAPVIAETTTVFVPLIKDLPASVPMTVNIPASIEADTATYNDLVATIEKIRPLGLKYTIQTF